MGDKKYTLYDCISYVLFDLVDPVDSAAPTTSKTPTRKTLKTMPASGLTNLLDSQLQILFQEGELPTNTENAGFQQIDKFVLRPNIEVLSAHC